MTNAQKQLKAELQRMWDADRKSEAAYPGRVCFSLTTDLAHWEGYGITSVPQLDAYLNAEFEREVRKSSW